MLPSRIHRDRRDKVALKQNGLTLTDNADCLASTKGVG